jgi:hypothetical protein
MKEFDYYIYIDYSENLIGYAIIEKEKVKDLLPKISRFRHYRESKNRKIYLKHIHNTVKREKICSYFAEFKIKRIYENIGIYTEVLDFIKKHENCVIFISIDDKQYSKFRKLIRIVDGGKTKVVKESELKRGTAEYQMSLVIDNMLNIRRKQQKK